VVGVLWGVVRVITWVLDRPPLRVEVPAGFPGELRRWLPFELTRAGELSLQPVVRDPVGSTSSTPVRLCRPGRWGPGRRSRVDLDAVSLAWLVQRGEVTPAARARERRDGDRALASVPQVVLHDHLSLVLERPARARVRVLPDGQRRLHGDDAPALEWSDGEVEHVVRGVQVPADLFEGRLSIAQIHALDNSEQRRIAIERMGWQRYLEQARLTPVAEADDPANPGATLRLYEVPGTEDARLLVMRNGSPDRSGVDRFYAEPVPARFGDPVEAAAWQYGCPVETYRALERRT